MDSVLFEEWVREINAEFNSKERKIALIIDNCPAHLKIKNFKGPLQKKPFEGHSCSY